MAQSLLCPMIPYLVGGFKHFYLSRCWEEYSQLTFICFRGVGSTTNQPYYFGDEHPKIIVIWVWQRGSFVFNTQPNIDPALAEHLQFDQQTCLPENSTFISMIVPWNIPCVFHFFDGFSIFVSYENLVFEKEFEREFPFFPYSSHENLRLQRTSHEKMVKQGC